MLGNLLKNEFWNMVGSVLSINKSNKKTFIFVISVIIISIIMSSFSYSEIMISNLKTVNSIDIAPLLMFFTTSSIIFIFGILYTSNNLFTFKDYDFLLSLPIKIRTIITSKLLFMYILNLILSLLIMIPLILVLNSYINLGNINIFLSILSIFLLPIAPMFLSNLIGIIISYFSKNMKNKNIFISIATFIVLAIIIILQNNVVNISEVANFSEEIKYNIYIVLPTSVLFMNVLKGDAFSLIIYFALSFLTTFIFIVLVSNYFFDIHSFLVNTKQEVKVLKNSFRKSKVFNSLIKKEIKMLLATPVYTVNTLFGVVTAVGLLIYAKFFSGDIIQVVLIERRLIVFVPLILGLLFSITPTTTCSLSLEGNKFWILKSLPIPTKKIYLSKIAFNLVINLPICILCSLFSVYIFESNFIWSIIIILFPLMLCIFSSYLGTILNILFPNFEWTNPAIVVKQGLPVLFNLFGIALYVYSLGFFVLKVFEDIKMSEMIFGVNIVLLILLTGILDLILGIISKR
ncbi:MAG: hypothetical protein R3Y64_00680 [Peptostreptococcaceae bacterium]